jgi:hypothetical protein
MLERNRVATGTVGPSGGQVSAPDGVLTITVPAGALASYTTITSTEIASPAGRGASPTTAARVVESGRPRA